MIFGIEVFLSGHYKELIQLAGGYTLLSPLSQQAQDAIINIVAVEKQGLRDSRWGQLTQNLGHKSIVAGGDKYIAGFECSGVVHL